MEKTTESILKSAIETFGREAQKRQAQEELSELITAISHEIRGRKNENVAEEIADVLIMLQQLVIIYDNAEQVAKFQNEKLHRLYSAVKRKNS
jgi:NTP pyrophosphatase (non-canonical NTP hydrolase)